MREISALLLLVFLAGAPLGFFRAISKHDAIHKMRSKVVIYCIEHPRLCREEYDNIKNAE